MLPNGVNCITLYPFWSNALGCWGPVVGLILTVPNGPVGPENRGVAGFTHLDTIPLSDESDPSWLEPELELKDFQLGSARLVTFFPSARNQKLAENELKFSFSFFVFLFM